MILATWNVNSVCKRLPQLLDWMAAVKPNLVCLQETKVTDDRFPAAEFRKLGYYPEFYGEKAYNGVAIISDRPLVDVERGFEQEVGPGSKRMIAGSYEKVRVIDVYIPNGGEVGSDKYAYKLEWIAALKGHLSRRHNPDELLVVTGDFNVAPLDIDVFDPAGAAGGILVSAGERQALADLQNWGLVDIFRKFHTQGGLYSWWDYRMNAFRKNMGFRIDQIWTSVPLSEKAKSVYIDKEPRKLDEPSDHAPVIAEFSL
jgi:exodeoxyribonuclease III